MGYVLGVLPFVWSACEGVDLCLRSFAQKYIPKVMPGHVVPEMSLEHVKDRLSRVRGALVECPMVSAFGRCCSFEMDAELDSMIGLFD